MFTSADYDKLEQLMAESPENEALLRKLLDSHKETISTISHEIRNPLTLVYST
jgi:two-component system sensor histidine kinase AtoS